MMAEKRVAVRLADPDRASLLLRLSVLRLHAGRPELGHKAAHMPFLSTAFHFWSPWSNSIWPVRMTYLLMSGILSVFQCHLDSNVVRIIALVISFYVSFH